MAAWLKSYTPKLMRCSFRSSKPMRIKAFTMPWQMPRRRAVLLPTSTRVMRPARSRWLMPPSEIWPTVVPVAFSTAL